MAVAGNGHPRHDHEHSDVSVRGLFYFIAALAIGGVLLHFGLKVFWNYLTTSAEHRPTSPFSYPAEPPPGPRLLPNPPEELHKYLASERRRLNSYGWVNREAGVVHIPIERAMELVLQRGLPVRSSRPPGEAEQKTAQRAGTAGARQPIVAQRQAQTNGE